MKENKIAQPSSHVETSIPNQKLRPKTALSSLYADDEDAGPGPEATLEFGEGNYEAIQHTCEAIGHVMESWGFKKIMGMTWAFLYLCPEPASAKDICSALKVSPALVSITLQELLRWDVVKKLSPMGKRRDYYVAEHDVWKMIRRVLKEREYAQIEKVRGKLSLAIEALDTEKEARPDLKSKRTCQFQRLRIEDLEAITMTAQSLLDAFVCDGKVDCSPIFSALKPYTSHASGLKS